MRILSEVRLTIRRLLRHDRQFAFFACATMALGLWVATLIFGIANGLLLRPLPYKDPGRLATITAAHPETGRINRGLSEAAVEHLRTLPAIETVGVYQARGLNVTAGSEPLRVAGAAARPDVFRLLDVHPVEGRIFSDEESRRGDRVIVVSERFVERARWQRPAVIGRTISVDGELHTVIGVMPARFRFPEAAHVWVPLPPSAATAAGGVSVVARLATNNEKVVHDQLELMGDSLVTTGHEAGWKFRSESLNPLRAEGLGPFLSIAVGASVLVLLVVSTNVAAVILARAVARQAEFGAMLALGATRWHIVRHVLLESAVIAAVAGGLALILTTWTLDLVPRALPVAELPEWMGFVVDRNVVAFTVVGAFLATVTTGLFPALYLPMRHLMGALRTGSRTVGGGNVARIQRTVLGVQLLVATVLLIGGGLMLRAYVALAQADLGYNPVGVYMLETEISRARYRQPSDAVRFYSASVEALEQSDAIRVAAVAGGKPGSRGGTQGTGSFDEIQVLGQGVSAQTVRIEQVVVSPGFFEVLELPLLQGRRFTPADSGDVAIVTEAFARRYSSSGAPLEQSLNIRTAGVLRNLRVIGVVSDMRDPFFGERGGGDAAPPRVYLPLAVGISAGATVYARAVGPANAEVGGTMSDVVGRVDPDQPVWAVTSLDDYLNTARSPVKWFGYVLGGCAAIALIVACVGMYGVVAYGVRRRQREFGIRAALGATQGHLLRIIMGEGLRPAAIGITIGVILGVALGRALTTLFYGIPVFDGLVIGTTVLLLLGAALLASFLPGYRILRSEPATVLREE